MAGAVPERSMCSTTSAVNDNRVATSSRLLHAQHTSLAIRMICQARITNIRVLVGFDFRQIVSACHTGLVDVDDHVNRAIHDELCVVKEVDLSWTGNQYRSAIQTRTTVFVLESRGCSYGRQSHASCESTS
jgi:hypothetical protein